MTEHRLLSFRAARRTVGVAVFSGLTLDCTFVRELVAEERTAKLSTRAFVRWALETFPADEAVIEVPSAGPTARSTVLASVIREELEMVLSKVTQLQPAAILAPADRPRRRPRRELRLLAVGLWPTFATRGAKPAGVDASILGLYRQVERLLEN